MTLKTVSGTKQAILIKVTETHCASLVQGVSERSLWGEDGAMGRVEVLGALRAWPNGAGFAPCGA